MTRDYEREERERLIRNIKTGALAALLLAAVITGISALVSAAYVVEPGHTATVYSLNGGLKDETYGEGLHWHWPWWEKERIEYTGLQTVETDHTAGTVDNADVYAKVSVSYRPDPSHLQDIQRTFRDRAALDYFVDKAVQNAVRNNTVRYGYEVTLKNRDNLTNHVIADLRESLEPRHIFLDEVFFTNLSFDPELMAAIEDTQIADQQAKTAKNRVAIANADADVKRATAQGDADRDYILADGKARATEREGEAIRAFPEVLRIRAIEAWAQGARFPYVMSDGDDPFNLLVPLPAEANTTGGT